MPGRYIEASPAPASPLGTSLGTFIIDTHQCKPSKLANLSAHHARTGTTVVCGCGKKWRVTKNHHGPADRICGCGWRLVES